MYRSGVVAGKCSWIEASTAARAGAPRAPSSHSAHSSNSASRRARASSCGSSATQSTRRRKAISAAASFALRSSSRNGAVASRKAVFWAWCESRRESSSETVSWGGRDGDGSPATTPFSVRGGPDDVGGHQHRRHRGARQARPRGERDAAVGGDVRDEGLGLAAVLVLADGLQLVAANRDVAPVRPRRQIGA